MNKYNENNGLRVLQHKPYTFIFLGKSYPLYKTNITANRYNIILLSREK